MDKYAISHNLVKELLELRACETEEEVLMEWANFIVDLDPDIITGYNIFGFDFTGESQTMSDKILRLLCDYLVGTRMMV